MNSTTDRILELLDNALETTDEPSYGDTTTSDGHCLRDRCDRPRADNSDFCGRCREYLLGDTDIDPIQAAPETLTAHFAQAMAPHFRAPDELSVRLESPRAVPITITVQQRRDGPDTVTLDHPHGSIGIEGFEVRHNTIDEGESYYAALRSVTILVSVDLTIDWGNGYRTTVPVVGDIVIERRNEIRALPIVNWWTGDEWETEAIRTDVVDVTTYQMIVQTDTPDLNIHQQHQHQRR